MQLIGMLDSPYVRRVAISLHLLELPFEHQSLSVFSTFEQFRAINPVVKAPTLVCDDGSVLMDSSLILEYVESLGGRSLMPNDLAARREVLRLTGLALAACEKSVQIVYEQRLRPIEKQHQPWLDRVQGQLLSAYGLLERAVKSAPPPLAPQQISQAGVSVAVAWAFTQHVLPGVVSPERHPTLQAFSEQAEQLAAFRACPQ
jgi:glutathione S-transferase